MRRSAYRVDGAEYLAASRLEATWMLDVSTGLVAAHVIPSMSHHVTINHTSFRQLPTHWPSLTKPRATYPRLQGARAYMGALAPQGLASTAMHVG